MDTSQLHLNSVFPLRASIWPGVLLASIGHAIFVARAPFMMHEQSWDGLNYNIQDSEGSRGTIAFDEDRTRFVAVFFLETSKRNPFGAGICVDKGATEYVRNVPDELRELTHKALQYVCQDIADRNIPLVTAAFWSDLAGLRATASEPWAEVVTHGAALATNQVLPVDVALTKWAIDFEFNPLQVSLVEILFRRRIAVTNGPIQLTKSEFQVLRNVANNEDGIRACRESLEEVGIFGL